MITGRDIRRAMNEAGVTMQEMADELGTTRATLYNKLNREQLPIGLVEDIEAKYGDKLKIQKSTPQKINDELEELKGMCKQYQRVIENLLAQVDELKKELELCKST